METNYTEEELVEFRNELRKFKEIASAKISVQQLQSSKIAQTVQTLSTLPAFDEEEHGEEIKKLCSQTINKWKKVVADQKAKQQGANTTAKPPQLTKQNSNPLTSNQPRRQSSGQGAAEQYLPNEEPTYKSESKTDLPTYSAETRQKGLTAIYNTFQKVRDEISVSPEEWIAQIVGLEKKVYMRSSLIINYKSHIREVLGMFSSNEVIVEVISKMLNKEITLQDVAEAKSTVFLTEAKRAEIKKSQEDQLAINDPEFYNNIRRERLRGQEGETCKACKKKTAFLVKELQTRSSDEPMTRFMECNNCGKSWRD